MQRLPDAQGWVRMGGSSRGSLNFAVGVARVTSFHAISGLLSLFGLAIHRPPALAGAGYVTGFLLHEVMRRGMARRGLPLRVSLEVRVWLLAGIALGALLGAKVVQMFEDVPRIVAATQPVPLETWLSGKTIVGGLIGAWVGTEIVKKVFRISRSTGDVWVFPLIAAIAVGRVGCFLSGLPDDTYGTPTGLAWGVDFGDGIRRHPTQLYEIAFVLLWAVPCVFAMRRWGLQSGRLFRFFLLGYMTFRFFVEFIKPSVKGYAGLSAIQIAAGCTALYCAFTLLRRASGGEVCAVARREI